MKAGLLNEDQLDAIFLNLDELIHVNKYFVSKLKLAIDSANQNEDHVSTRPFSDYPLLFCLQIIEINFVHNK